jgi:hypothetical protein
MPNINLLKDCFVPYVTYVLHYKKKYVFPLYQYKYLPCSDQIYEVQASE